MTDNHSPLTRYLVDLIQQDGPISVATYMDLALGHPEHGYYMTRDPLGRAGDFTTSPEISQMFGELLGLWCVDMWDKLGRPDPFVLAELGPGRGTLMADALRAAAVVPDFIKAARVAFVEMSPVLREAQKKNVPSANLYNTFNELPEGPLLLIANEFFDALPIRQFQRTELGWCERRIGLAPLQSDLPFQFGLTQDAVSPTLVPAPVRKAPLGSIAETCPLAETLISQLAQRLQTSRGAALIIDYGHLQSAAGDTLQAMRDHKYVDVFDTPGEADITAHVDFANLREKAGGCTPCEPVQQGYFLKALGIDVRAEKLKQRATLQQAQEIDTSLARLTEQGAMGKLFKVMALTSPHLPTPAGFAE